MAGSDVGAGLPTRRFYYVLVLLGDDTRLSSKLAVVRRDNARRSAQRRRRVSDKPQGNNIPFSVREASGVIKVYKGIALRQVFERIALRNGQGVCGNAQPDY